MVSVDRQQVRQIVEHFGAYAQISKAVEELIELSEVLIKDINKAEVDKDSLYEELADVCVMFYQLKIIYNIDDTTLQEEVDKKVDRTLQRIQNVTTDCNWK